MVKYSLTILLTTFKWNHLPAAEITFFVCLFPRRLDGKHVVFGQVKEGMDVVTKMESFGLHDGGVIKKIVITDCGEIK